MIDYAFTDLAHEALQAGARVTNPASRRVLEKCGFQWTGVGLYRISVDQVVGADRPLPARARHLDGAQELGPVEEGDVNYRACGLARDRGGRWRPGCIAFRETMRETVLRPGSNYQGGRHGLRPRPIHRRLQNRRSRATPARRGANRCAPISNACSPTPTSSRTYCGDDQPRGRQSAVRGPQARLPGARPYQRQGARLAAARSRRLLGDLRPGHANTPT